MQLVGPKRLAMVAVIGVVAGLMIMAVVVRLIENRFIYFPPRYPEGFLPVAQYPFRFEDVWLTADDGVKINAWYVPNPASRKVLLMFHGNALNLGQDGTGRLDTFARLGVNLLEIDYRGYGKSEGTPHEAGLYRDADAAYRYLREIKRHQASEICIYGHSLGSAVATDLASRRECGGLIIESAFSSGREMARRMFAIPLFHYLPKTKFDTLAKIRTVRAPILVIHGADDNLIPMSMGKALYEAAPHPKSFLAVARAGHDDAFITGGERYIEALRQFVGP